MGVGALSYLERTEGCCGEEQEKIFTGVEMENVGGV